MTLARLARMDVDEIAWRARAASRIAWDRLQSTRTPPAWSRTALLDALARDPALDDIRSALDSRRWSDAHRALALHLTSMPQRFALSPSCHSALRAAIPARFRGAAGDATARAERILDGQYDLLGYRGLSFAHRHAEVDWHADPVHNRRAPGGFWADVPYLDPRCGDHKIIWELNRHQHWLALGRAFWLTGDVRYRRRCLTELAGWLDANPPLTGINWASMLELGFRCLSWMWALAFFADPGAPDEDPWIVDLLVALDRQLTHVERNLSHYFSPNTHLLGEALALYVCGRGLPLLARSAGREALGRRILLDEAGRQIAADGGHCERSTHYHRYTLDFYLLALAIARITGDPAAAEFAATVSRLADAARLLADDEGRMPLIGDDDGGMLFPIAGRPPADIRDSLATAAALLDRPDLQIGPAPEETYWLLAHPSLAKNIDSDRGPERHAPRSAGPASTALRDTGYYISRNARGDHLVIDGGVHGYLNGGHAHADALSLTFTVAGAPLLIDPGTGAYTVNPALRDRLRSSEMHNTLVVDGRSQSIVKGPFSWSTMAHSRVREWKTDAHFDYFEGSHDGYQPIEHRRHVLTLHGDLLVVADLLLGDGTHTASVHWQIDPRWRVTIGESAVTFATAAEQCQLAVPRGRIERFHGDDTTGLGWHAPVYGRLEPSTSLRITHRDAVPFWMATVFGLSSENAVVGVEFVPSGDDDVVMLRVIRRTSIDLVQLGDVEAGTRMLFCREHIQLRA